MKIPRKLKAIVSKAGGLSIDSVKRSYAVVRPDGTKFTVDMGHIVTVKQWEDLETRILAFAKA